MIVSVLTGQQLVSRIQFIFIIYGGNWKVIYWSNAGDLNNQNIAPVTANLRVKLAIAYSSNQLRISFNGSAVTTYIWNLLENGHH